ncbi:hypothetical protein OYC64_002910 [Pagothenia borchgrevinki]|uniref:Uncharacterized protein n=1 Tax=Pagothenia borchgrevinki TaxID=8213 RepID=A0ABD2HBG9_PAGBO
MDHSLISWPAVALQKLASLTEHVNRRESVLSEVQEMTCLTPGEAASSLIYSEDSSLSMHCGKEGDGGNI